MNEEIVGLSCAGFVEALASSRPVPGGGGAAALVGAVGTALGNMVGALTVGKKRYADVEEEIIALRARCSDIQARLLEQVEADAEAFEPLSKAYGIPRDDPTRAQVLEEATLCACRPPVRIMELCCEAIELAKLFAEKGSRLAVSDAGCAAACLRAALESASLNVFINTRTLRDRARAEEIEVNARRMLDKYVPMAQEVFDGVRTKLEE
ncbi:MAG: cyclodeaminase/cyclohydrolase family protein [Clostridiales bacterium]|nr:cyclodeaminase/cyclohydrolase family protein [Clostridiales bacterium]